MFGVELVTIHLATLVATILVIAYADHEAFAYFRGKKDLLNKRRITRLHYLVWVGLITMIVTGFALALPGLSYYLSEPLFLLKMGFVLVLIINSLFITKLLPIASERPFRELKKNEQRILLLSGAASASAWIGASIIGYFFL